MNRVIDARVRLPRDLRPALAADPLPGFMDHYDTVLGLSTKTTRTFEDLVQEMDATGVDHAVMHVEYETGDSVDEMNAAVARVVASDPARFSGFGSVSLNSGSIQRTVSQVRRVAADGLKGLNIQPAFMGLAIDSRSLYPIYSVAAELGLVVAIHTGVNYARSVPMYLEHPCHLDRIACDFPDLQLIACHASWPWVDEVVAVARRHPSVYLEFGGLSPQYVGAEGTGWSTARRMMDSVLSEQVLFATDWPVMTADRCLEEWRQMDLKPSTLERLLGSNVAKLLGVTPESRSR